MRAAIVTTFVTLSMALLCSSAFADDYASATARCAKEYLGEFAAQMACIQRERSEPSRSDETESRRPEIRSITNRSGYERALSSRSFED